MAGLSLFWNPQLNPLFETARGQVRMFKRLYAAVGILFDIGFEDIKILKYQVHHQ